MSGKNWDRVPIDAQSVDAPLSQLMVIFRGGMVAIVTEGEKFLGIITRIDLLNWLRRRLID